MAAVRTISPAPGGVGSRASVRFSRSRSFSSSILRETPLSRVPGTITRYRPGILKFAVTRGPFVPIDPFVTCTTISVPGGKRFSTSSFEMRFHFEPRRRGASSSISNCASPSGTMSQ